MEYIPPGGRGGTSVDTPQGSSGSGSTGLGSSGDISAIDILELSNSGDTQSIVDLFATGTTTQNDEAGTQNLTFPASSIGLPSGGTATLTISGGSYSYSGTASVDANGNVSFEIPMIPSGIRITVGLTVKGADGTLLYSGSKEQSVRGDSMQISVALARQFWTLPASIHAVASPARLPYNTATAGSDSCTISIEGFEDAPADVSYVWTDESGTQLGTGPTLPLTANEITGGTAPVGEITKTYTVAVSYTDAAGEAKTASASATVTVRLAVPLPAFTIDIEMDVDGYSAALSDLTTDPELPVYALTDLTKEFTFTANPGAGVTFPAGTKFQWKITGEGTPYEPALSDEDDTDIEATVDLFGLTGGSSGTLGATPATANTITIECTATNDYALEDVDATAASAKVFRAPPEGFVLVDDLYVCIHEVTQGEYEQYCDYGGLSPSATYGVGTDFPAYYVSWYDALVYCNRRSMTEGLTPCYTIDGSTDPADWTGIGTGSNGKPCGPSSNLSNWNNVTVDTSADGYRLPTVAEWVQAASDGHECSGADMADVGDVAWYDGNSGTGGGSSSSGGKAHEVKTKEPNAKGIYDMSGNVWEWCWDWHSDGSSRSAHGGSWINLASDCAVSVQGGGTPYGRGDMRLGFRVVRKAD